MFTFVETQLFSPLVYDYLSEEEYSSLQRHLAAWPESGDVVPGTGGVRKVRWAGRAEVNEAVFESCTWHVSPRK